MSKRETFPPRFLDENPSSALARFAEIQEVLAQPKHARERRFYVLAATTYSQRREILLTSFITVSRKKARDLSKFKLKQYIHEFRDQPVLPHAASWLQNPQICEPLEVLLETLEAPSALPIQHADSDQPVHSAPPSPLPTSRSLSSRCSPSEQYSKLLAAEYVIPSLSKPVGGHSHQHEYYDYFRELIDKAEPAKPIQPTDLHQRRYYGDYCVVETRDQLNLCLDRGLLLPVFVSRDSALGKSFRIGGKLPISERLKQIFRNGDATVDVQNLGADPLEQKKLASKIVQRLETPLKDRTGAAWNCLELDNKRPIFQHPLGGGILEDLQLPSPDLRPVQRKPQNAARQHIAPLQGAKRLSKWVLVSEQGAQSRHHSDIPLGTFLTNENGKKTIWLRTEVSRLDQALLENYSSPDGFTTPWVGLTLSPGDTLIFMAGTHHAVFTLEDSIFSGGHFLHPSLMSQSLAILMDQERCSALTNDKLPVDILNMHLNFMEDIESFGLAEEQVKQYWRVLRVYLENACRSRLIQKLAEDRMKDETQRSKLEGQANTEGDKSLLQYLSKKRKLDLEDIEMLLLLAQTKAKSAKRKLNTKEKASKRPKKAPKTRPKVRAETSADPAVASEVETVSMELMVEEQEHLSRRAKFCEIAKQHLNKWKKTKEVESSSPPP